MQSCIEQERRGCRLLFLLVAACAIWLTIGVGLFLQRRQQPDLERIKERWRQEANNTNLDERGIAGPLPPYLERLSTNK